MIRTYDVMIRGKKSNTAFAPAVLTGFQERLHRVHLNCCEV